MKKSSLIVALVMGLFFSPTLKAQSTANYFIGKWAITVTGTPNGDTKLMQRARVSKKAIRQRNNAAFDAPVAH